MANTKHFVNGAALACASGCFSDVFNPNTGEVQAAVAAQLTWGTINPQRRERVM